MVLVGLEQIGLTEQKDVHFVHNKKLRDVYVEHTPTDILQKDRVRLNSLNHFTVPGQTHKVCEYHRQKSIHISGK